MKIVSTKIANCMISSSIKMDNSLFDECIIEIDSNQLSVYTNNTDLINYCVNWIRLLFNPVLGTKTYPEMLNIKDDISNEIMSIIIKDDREFVEYKILPKSISLNDTNKRIIFNLIDGKIL